MQTQTVEATATVLNLNQAKLKEVTNASHTSVVTMLFLALRQRDRGFSNIPGTKEQLIKMGEKIVDDDFSKFWRDLQAIGVGSIVFGRRGNPDRFKWHYSLKNVAQSAIEGRQEEIKLLAQKKKTQVTYPVPAKRKVKRTRKPKPIAKPERQLYSVHLASGGVAEIILPKSISVSELAQVRKALRR